MEEKVTCFTCPLGDCAEPCPFGCDQDFDEDLDEYIFDDVTLKRRKYALESYHKNKGHMKERKRAYFLKNKDKINAQRRKHRLVNKDKINARKRELRLKKKMFNGV